MALFSIGYNNLVPLTYSASPLEIFFQNLVRSSGATVRSPSKIISTSLDAIENALNTASALPYPDCCIAFRTKPLFV